MSFVSVSEDEEDRRDILHCAEKGDSLPGGRVVKTFEGELNHRQNAIKKQYEGVNKDAPAKMGDFAKLDTAGGEADICAFGQKYRVREANKRWRGFRSQNATRESGGFWQAAYQGD